MLEVEGILAELQRFNGGAGVLSVYLSLDPSTAVGRDVHAQLAELERHLRAQAGAPYEADLAAVRAYVARLDPPPRGVAVFACAAHAKLRAVPLPVRTAPLAVWGTAPYLRPLLAALDEAERTIVVLIDKQQARLFRTWLGQIEELPPVASDVPPKHRQFGGTWSYPPGAWSQGGWAQSGLRRQHEAHLQHHARNAVEVLSALAQAERVDRIVLGGSPEALVELRRLVPKALRSRLAGEIHPPMFATPAQVLAEVEAVAAEHERAAEVRLLAELREQAGAGRAAFGADAVVEAVNARQVYVLVVGHTARLAGAYCPTCDRLAAADPPAAGGVPVACPVCRGAMEPVPDLVEALIEAVLARGGRIEEVRGAAAAELGATDGLAAWLRYPAAGHVGA